MKTLKSFYDQNLISFRYRQTIILLVFVCLVMLVYKPTLNSGFIWDDDQHVTENHHLKSIKGLAKIWFHLGATNQYYPMVYTLFFLEYQIWRNKPFGYHLLNILLHALNAFFLWKILKELSVPYAFVVALVFAVHPVHVETVAWISEQKNTLSTFFYLISFLFFIRFIKLSTRSGEFQHAPSTENKKMIANPYMTFMNDTFIYYLLSFLFFIFAVLSKSVTCSLPAALFLVLWWENGTINKREALLLTPFLLVGLILGLTTIWFEKNIIGAQGLEWELSYMDRILVAGRALCFYIKKLILPVSLSFNYPRWVINSGKLWPYLYPLIILILFGSIFTLRNKIGRGPIAMLFFFAGTLVPAIGFFNVYPHRYSFVADHFQYLASIGIILFVVCALWSGFNKISLAKRNDITYVIVLLIISILAIISFKQSRNYKNEFTLYMDTIKKNPDSWLAHNNLGLLLYKKGRCKQALYHLKTAVELNPNSAIVLINKGNVLACLGQIERAIKYYRKSIYMNPKASGGYKNIGLALLRKGKLKEAIQYFQQGLRIRFDQELDNCLIKANKFQARIQHLENQFNLIQNDDINDHAQVNKINKLKAEFNNLIKEYKKSLSTQPGFQDHEFNPESLTSYGDLLNLE